MDFESITFGRDDSGATRVSVYLKVPRAGKFDAGMIDRVISILDGGEPEASRDTGNEDRKAPLPTETGRRSRRAPAETHEPATTAENTPANPTAESAEPAATGRRSRRTATAAPAQDTAPTTTNVGATASEPPPARRRRVPEAPAGISDADLTKAASEGARVLGPEFVTAWLTEFGVGEVSKLAQGVRREFIDGISDEIEKKAA